MAIEITNKCPLSCPGCYAYRPNHVSGKDLHSLLEYRGDELVARVLCLLDERRPQGLFLVGGEPLVRIQELNRLLPEVCRRGIETEVVTSGVVRIPAEWKHLRGLTVVVSIDGLQSEHDRRRAPATYERILSNIQGHRIQIHCTITSQMAKDPGSVNQFLSFWCAREEVIGIRVSLYTPQIGEKSMETLSQQQRVHVIHELHRLKKGFKKLRLSDDMVTSYLNPPKAPDKCIFARVTDCVASDLKTPILPCQLGGEPDCSLCGCVAAIGMQAVGRYRLPGGIPISEIFRLSDWTGNWVLRVRNRFSGKRA